MRRLSFSFFLLTLAACSGQQVQPAPRQVEHTTPARLLNENGFISVAGWARRGVFEFDAAAIAVPRERLKQWDFFTISDGRVAVNVTLADIGFAGMCTVDAIDLWRSEAVNGGVIHLAPAGKLFMGKTSDDGSVCLNEGKPALVLTKEGTQRKVWIDIPATPFTPAVQGKFLIEQPADYDYLAAVLPFGTDRREFFYENKIPGLPTQGWVSFDGKTYTLARDKTFAVMDWGRGVWPRSLRWRWGAASGKEISLNLGHGFGDTSAGTENLVIYQGRGHKLGEVNWTFQPFVPINPWKLSSPDGRVDMHFEPIYDQVVQANMLVKSAELHKVYGYYSGTIVLDDGQTVKVDRLFGFAEEMGLLW